ncbi:hypothetical protein [Gordonia paraffinivorans]|uniref:hypothetical protein n=1 Tax=Gordonia paraffinivorans TaxID=175628 RepID=UPI001445A8D2|nr:hypothetical protein [Gordonia paraffinivorans]
MIRRRFRSIIATGAAALVGGGAMVAPGAPSASAAPPNATTTVRCESDSSGKPPPGGWYHGESASYLYDRRFREGPILSKEQLGRYTPQAIAYWKDWDDSGRDALLIATYVSGGADDRAKIIAVDANTPHRLLGWVMVDKRSAGEMPTHAGGMAIGGGHLFLSGPQESNSIRHYALADVRNALQQKGSISPKGADRKVHGQAFMTVDGNKLYAGRFNLGSRDWMHRYTIKDDGRLETDPKPGGNGKMRYEVPKGTQGVAKAGNTMFFSTSLGRNVRSNFYATDAGETNLDKARPRCFRGPSMSQGIAIDAARNRLFLNYESGSHKFDDRAGDPARNIIRGANIAKLEDVTSVPGGTLKLGTLQAKKLTDTDKEDEIVVSVEGAPICVKGSDDKCLKHLKLKQGKQRAIDATVQFTGNALVNVTERDNPPDNPHDNLGTEKLTPGAKKGILEFAKGRAVYRLSYEVS